MLSKEMLLSKILKFFVPVKPLFDYLEGGETLEEFLEGSPAFLAKWPRSARTG
jgi:hypothetical protein